MIFSARLKVSPLDAIQSLKLALENVWIAFNPEGLVVILRERKIEGFDALFSAPACGVSVSVHIQSLGDAYFKGKQIVD